MDVGPGTPEALGSFIAGEDKKWKTIIQVAAARAGEPMPGNWLIDEAGVPTNDPAVVTPPRTGAILPLGAVDAGHKGYGLSLMGESLTARLS